MFSVVKRAYILVLSTGQTLHWYGSLGALVMGLTFTGVIIHLIYTMGLAKLVEEDGVLINLIVLLSGIGCLIVAWGRVRLMMGKEAVDLTPNLRGLPMGGLSWLLNGVGILFAIFAFMSPLVLLDWILTK